MNLAVALVGGFVSLVGAATAGYLVATMAEVPDGHGWVAILLGVLVGAIVFVALWFLTVLVTIVSSDTEVFA